MSELSMQELVEYLNKCTVAYDQGNPIISDEEWDNLYFHLLDMEIKAGITEENVWVEIKKVMLDIAKDGE